MLLSVIYAPTPWSQVGSDLWCQMILVSDDVVSVSTPRGGCEWMTDRLKQCDRKVQLIRNKTENDRLDKIILSSDFFSCLG